MNYIHKLQAQVKEQKELLEAYERQRIDLHVYLLSPKFHKENTVQCQDVLNRTTFLGVTIEPDKEVSTR